jgi:hypothetical protein
MPSPSHPSGLDHSNYTCRRLQVMKLCITQLCEILTYSTQLLLYTSHCNF